MKSILLRLGLALGLLALAVLPTYSLDTPAVAPPAVSAGQFVGDWLGALEVGANKLRIGFSITKKADGGLDVEVDSLDQGAKIPVAATTWEGGTLRLNLAAAGATYVGQLNAAGDTLEGTWSQAKQTLPLNLRRGAKPSGLNRPQLPQAPFPYESVDVQFESGAGNLRLAGTLVVPSGKGPFPAVLLISGSGPQDRDETSFGHKPLLVIADALARRGIASLRCDDRGVGGSGGVYFASTMDDLAADAKAALGFLRARPEIAQGSVGILGHSEGGLIGPKVAVTDRSVSFLVLLAPPGEPLRALLERQDRTILKLAGVEDELIDRVAAAAAENVDLAADLSLSKERLEEKLRALAKVQALRFTEAERARLGMNATTLEGSLQTAMSPWFRSLIHEDPAVTLRQIKIPTLALFGGKDAQVEPQISAQIVRSSLGEAKNPDFEVSVLPGLNHFFQHAETGGLGEYASIEETMSPEVLRLVGDWITARSKAQPSSNSRSLRIENARLIDGTGAPARTGSVRIVDDRIVEVGAVGEIAPVPGEEVFDAHGLVLAPGFIDTHSHAAADLFEIPSALGAVSQGITTIIGGQDGGSSFPLSDEFARLEKQGMAVNVASYSGHGTLRDMVLGEDFRRVATTAEVAEMAKRLEQDLDAGALGLSSGLEYDPGIYSARSELIELAKVTARHGGRYISHIRSEDRTFWDAIDEILTIGREAKLPVQISHVKLAMRTLWGQAPRLLSLLDQARAQGIDVTADIYPYLYWHSSLTVLFPNRDFENLDVARQVLAEIAPAEGLLLGRYLPNPAYRGRTVAEIAKERGEAPEVTLVALIRDAEAMRRQGKEGVESVIATSMIEADVDQLLTWPHSNLCTDGELDGRHPRGFGSYPRVLGRYVRERGVLSLERAIHQMTALAADHVGIRDRGRLVPGAYADLVLFDPSTVLDRATTSDPHALSVGIERVWVNGKVVFAGGTASGLRPGRVLRR